jgi:hypothetical protein
MLLPLPGRQMHLLYDPAPPWPPQKKTYLQAAAHEMMALLQRETFQMRVKKKRNNQ